MKVTPTAASAAEFLRSESYITTRFAMLSTFWFDIQGGIAESQDGMTLASSRNALWDALALFLITRRVMYQMPTSHIALRTLLEEVVDDNSLLAELDGLLLRNPDTHEEVVDFAEGCLHFIDYRLGMKQARELYGDFTSWEQLAVYQRRLLDLAEMADDLDFDLPQPIEAIRARVGFRAEIERRVAGKLDPGPAG